jgi:AraC family transcriptional regulator of adaptative response / DNA-3-methyladenine glycosylase II
MTTAPTGFDERYRTVESRDARFDGQFVMAVRTTGIYCRPSCPARTPKPQNVSFYASSAAAQEAGYRACRRCLPDAAPGSPDWDLRGDTTGRAMRLIADGVVEREGVEGLAAHLGYSARHVTRVLTRDVGAGPSALARAHRAHTARLLLTCTEMPVSDIAFSAGFGSVRQCNETFREVFGVTPTALRAMRGRPDPVAGGIDLVLPVRPPFDLGGILEWLAARAVPGMEQSAPGTYSRTVALPGGPGWFSVGDATDATDATDTGDAGAPRGRLRLRARLTELSDITPLVARVRRLFDMDADPTAVDSTLVRVPELTDTVKTHPGTRVPGSVDAHETLVRTMIGQQISVASARTLVGTLVAELGGEYRAPDAPSAAVFPTMEAIAEHGRTVLRGPRSRVLAVTETAAALADGSLSVSFADDPDDLRDRLLARRGIGPWTADYVRMRVLGDPDVMLASDSAARAGATRLGIPDDRRNLMTWSEQITPWRSYATHHLWRAAAPEHSPEPSN